MNDNTFLAIDCETTGISPVNHRIIELAAVHFDATGNVLSEFSELVNPGIPIPPLATSIHGITDEMVVEAEAMLEVIVMFWDWCGQLGDGTLFDITHGSKDMISFAHNAEFDRGFLESEWTRNSLRWDGFVIHCTLAMSRRRWPGLRSYSLGSLVDYLNIKSDGPVHRALADAHAVRRLAVVGGFLEGL